MSNSILIKGGSIVGAEVSDLLIRDGAIVEMSPSITTEADQVVDATGCVLLPGFVDLHTHLREPGRENSETIATGSLAAARGGYVAVSAMANTLPVADTAAIVEQVASIGKRVGLVDVFPIGAVTKGLEGHDLADLSISIDAGGRERHLDGLEDAEGPIDVAELHVEGDLPYRPQGVQTDDVLAAEK